MQLKTFQKFKAIPSGKAYDEFPVLVRVTAPFDCPEWLRVRVDVVVVVDVSGSAWGTRIDGIEEALNFVIDHLNTNDRLCIVTYNHKAERLTPLLDMNDQGRAMLRWKVEGIAFGGGDAGMDDALYQAEEVRANNVS